MGLVGSEDRYVDTSGFSAPQFDPEVTLHRLRHDLIALGLTVVFVFVLVLVGNGPLARWLARSLQEPTFFKEPDSFGRRSAVVLLGDGIIREPTTGELMPRWLAYSRIEKTAEVYRAAKASGASCTIVVSGDDSAATEAIGRSVYIDRLGALGVPAADTRLESEGRNTYRQAELTKRILVTESYDRIFIITSGLHMKRALQYFRHFGLKLIPVASDYVAGQLTLVPSGQNIAIADIAIHQYIGMVRLRVYNVLGWNK